MKKNVGVFQWLFYPGLSVMCVVSVHEVDDLPWHVVEVEDRRICVQAGGMELVTVFHGQFSKGSEVLFLHSVDHLYHPVWDHGVSSVLQVQGQRRQRLVISREHASNAAWPTVSGHTDNFVSALNKNKWSNYLEEAACLYTGLHPWGAAHEFTLSTGLLGKKNTAVMCFFCLS